MFKKTTLLGLFLAAISCPFVGDAQAVPVDLELVLAVDVSGSISDTEYSTQKNGYVSAFTSQSVINAITNGTIGSIAVTYVEWSSYNKQSTVVDWMLIDDATSANQFASSISNATRAYSDNTGVSEAISYSSLLFANNRYEGTRLVIDVSGDGQDNSGSSPTTAEARDAALASGVDAINGLIVGGGTSLTNWYLNNVIGGTGSFAVYADGFDQFPAAVLSKLEREISNNSVPEPTTLMLLGVGVAGLAFSSRRRSSN